MVPRVSVMRFFISRVARVAERVWVGRLVSRERSVFVFGLVRARYTFCSLSVSVVRSKVCCSVGSSPRIATMSCPFLMGCAPSRMRVFVPAPISEKMVCGTAPTSLL